MEPNHSDFSGGLHLWSRAGSLLLPFQVKQSSLLMLSGYSMLRTIFVGMNMENICRVCNWKTFQWLVHICAPEKIFAPLDAKLWLENICMAK